jgi:predicted metal-dependent phosphoesterase TrpH
MTQDCRVDFHCHTSPFSACSRQKAPELALAAIAAGLHVLFLTDHDYQWPEYDLAALRPAFPALTILAGVEIACLDGEHLLAFGLPEYRREPGFLTLAQALKLVHAAGGIGIIAHPFRFPQDRSWNHHQRLAGLPLDAVEVCSVNVPGPPGTELARQLAQELRVPALAASDGHEVEMIGRHYSLFPGPIHSVGDFVTAIRAGQGRTAGLEVI